MQDVEIAVMSPSLVEEYLDDLCALDRELGELVGDVWGREEWLCARHLKWRLSMMGFSGGHLVSLMVNSVLDGCVHTHRIGVCKDYRRRGWGRWLYGQLFDWAVRNGYENATARSYKDNIPALKLLEFCGYQRCPELDTDDCLGFKGDTEELWRKTLKGLNVGWTFGGLV